MATTDDFINLLFQVESSFCPYLKPIATHPDLQSVQSLSKRLSSENIHKCINVDHISSKTYGSISPFLLFHY